MIWIIFVKVILVILSVITLGILPLIALLNWWIWNDIIVLHVLSSAIPIKSFWIILGLTTIGGGFIGSILGGTIKGFIKAIFK